MKNFRKAGFFKEDRPAYMKDTFGSKIFDYVNLFLLVLITLSCIMPVWYTLCVSLSKKSYIAAGVVSFWPKGFNILSYQQIIADKAFARAFLNSIIRVGLGTSITVFVIILMAYPLSKSKKEFQQRNIFMWILVFCMLFNGGLIPWFQTMRQMHLINNVWGLIFGGGLPIFSVILMMNFFRNNPKEIEEAGSIDGAGPWGILFRIIVPISKPVIATIVLFTAIYHWNEFFNGLILSTSEANYPLQTYIQQLVVQIDTTIMTEDQYKMMSEMSNQSLNAAKLFVAIVPVLIVYPFLQKYIISGITLGSVKG